MSKTYKERIERLDDIKECLMSDRKFYLSRKDWPKVNAINESIRQHDEQMAKAIRHFGKDAYKSA